MSFLLLTLALVGLVWGLVFAVRGSLAAGCLALLSLGYIFGHNFVNFDLGPLPLTVDRLILGGLLAAYGAKWLLRRVDHRPWTWVEYTLAAFIGLLVVSTFTHDFRVSAPGRISPLWLLVAGYVTPAIIYFLARDSGVNSRSLVLAYATLTLLGVYLSVTALAEISQQWWAVFPKYIADPKLGIHYGRARGPMLQSQSLGFYLVACFLCAWAWMRSQGTKEGKLAIFLLFPLFLAAIYFTYTRCIWLGAGAAVVVVLGLSLHGAWRPLALTAALGLGLVVTIAGWDSIVGIEREAGAAAARDSVSQRGAFTYVSWQMFLDKPLFGFGFGQFTDAKLPYLADRDTALYLEAIRIQPHHNTFLSLLTETGVVGLGLYVALLAGFAWRAWSLVRNPAAPPLVRTQGILLLALLAFYFGPALFFDLTYSPNDHWILFFLAGLTTALVPAASPAPHAAVAPRLAHRQQPAL